VNALPLMRRFPSGLPVFHAGETLQDAWGATFRVEFGVLSRKMKSHGVLTCLKRNGMAGWHGWA
jgi:hypothetical protein